MTADWDIEEAARLIDRACRLLAPHRATYPSLGFAVRTLRIDLALVKACARNAREGSEMTAMRLFA